MKGTFLLAPVVFLLGLLMGRATAPKPKAQPLSLGGCAVDCYDAKGNLVPDPFKKFGGVQLGCAPGETPRLHQR